MTDDEWVKVAMVEDAVVAELLTSLKETKSTAPPSTSAPAKPALSFEWRVRQRRSKGVVVPTKKQTPTSSPTTPLSWSGATSISVGGGGQGGGGDGSAANESGRGFEVEESSLLSTPPSAPKISDIARSKVSGLCEVSTTKKYRKKKTLAVLKEEEVLLERERRQLKRELESIRNNLERERIRNQNFKKMKQQMSSFKPVCLEKMENAVGKFELPDLNLPLGEENTCGAR